MDWIAARYKECLCSNCLVKIAAGELGPEPDWTSKKQEDRERQSCEPMADSPTLNGPPFTGQFLNGEMCAEIFFGRRFQLP